VNGGSEREGNGNVAVRGKRTVRGRRRAVVQVRRNVQKVNAVGSKRVACFNRRTTTVATMRYASQPPPPRSSSAGGVEA